MNLVLRREIVRQIFDRFGLMTNKITNGYGLSGIMKNEFLLDQRLVFVGEEQEGKVWAVSCEIGKTVLQALVADTKDDIDEFTILIRADKLPTYAMQLSADPNDSGLISYHIEHNGKEHWIEANTVVQAKCLIGVESLSEQFLEWKKLVEHKEMFGLLIEFMKQGE